jgi:protein-S-isoprenylcysteine O-methyltransferase Ste14
MMALRTATVLATPRKRPAAELGADLALAATLLAWAALGWWSARKLASSIPWTIAGLHLGVALHVAGRSRLVRRARPAMIAASIPAVAMGGCAFALAAPVATWPATLEGLFVMGSVLTLSSFLALGRSFGILPGVRSVVTRGPYRWIRHPAYLGELFMVLATTLSRPGLSGFPVFCCAVLLVWLRIHAEETLLLECQGYRSYTEETTFRLVPGLW